MKRSGLASLTLFLRLLFLLVSVTIVCEALRLPVTVSTGSAQAAQLDEERIAPIVASAEFLFKAMKAKDYTAIWSRLSAKSHKKIAEDVYKALGGKKETRHSVDLVEKDFSAGGPIAQSYWNAYLANFDPDSVLEQSTWGMGSVKKDKAEINILYKRAENPASLKMFKENGLWMVGLVETFWGRK